MRLVLYSISEGKPEMTYEGSLYAAHEALRLVQHTAEDKDAEEALTKVIHDLETVMSDHFDLYVEA